MEIESNYLTAERSTGIHQEHQQPIFSPSAQFLDTISPAIPIPNQRGAVRCAPENSPTAPRQLIYRKLS
jgi:hypothetical protein